MNEQVPPPDSLRDFCRRLHSLERAVRRSRLELGRLHETLRLQASADVDLAREQASLARELQAVRQQVDAIGKTLHIGNGSHSLTTRMAVLETELTDLQGEVGSLRGEHWKLLVSLATGLLGLVSSVILWFVKGGPR